MLDFLARTWWIVALRGVLTLLFGLAAFLIPHDSQAPLRTVFGIFALADGAVAVAASLQFARSGSGWRWLAGEGALGIVLGALALLVPGLSKPALAAVIALWAIGTGALGITAALRLRDRIASEWLWIASGVASIVFGLLIAVFPLVTLALWTLVVVTYAVVAGVALLALALFLRRLVKRRGPGGVARV